MSGIASRVFEKKEKVLLELQKQKALHENRGHILQAVADFMTAKYGEGSFVMSHPLINAVFTSLGGGIVDLEQLAADCSNWQPETD